ncbi:MAG: prepilin-type N-terminal cleavage/methylation domain-containing protein [Patescibacteria group bacterium]
MIIEKKISQGFTLIETLIYIAIMGMAVSSFVLFSISVLNSRSKTYVVQEVQANARTAMDIMSRKIRASTGVNIGASTFGSDPGILSLSMADVSKNPTIFSLNQNDGVLQITEGLSPALFIVSDEVKITNLSFTNATGSGIRENIRIDMTVDYNNPDTDIIYDYSQSLRTTIGVRQ